MHDWTHEWTHRWLYAGWLFVCWCKMLVASFTVKGRTGRVLPQFDTMMVWRTHERTHGRFYAAVRLIRSVSV